MTRVLISGGGIAGSALAILLGRQGIEVELFERRDFPHEKPCGEGLMPAGVSVVERMGLQEAVGGEPFYGVRYHFGDFAVEGRFPSQDGRPSVGWGQRRLKLDEALFRAASVTPGVTAHVRARVDAPLVEGGRVVGLIVDGEPRRGSLVVAADGIDSPIRKAAGLDLPPRRKRFGVCAHFRLAGGRLQPPWVDVFVRKGHELYVTPLPAREVLVAALVEAGAMEGTAEQAYSRWLQAEPVLAERLEGAEQITPIAGRSPLTSRARSGVAPGLVLLGDAAGFVDPITGGGMAQALVSAELLARYAANRGLAKHEAWLDAFDRERSAMLRDYRILTNAMLWLASRPRLARNAFRAMTATPRLFSHLLGVSGGFRTFLGSSMSASVADSPSS
jgi:2-polyprenyl-6-methoxyphenol hydroxylase-like FAD-dependent oxidoreductase